MRISKTKDVKTPTRGTPKSAGLDFYIPNDFPETSVAPKKSIRIDSGIKVEVPKNHALIAFNKSGIAISGLSVGACVIDEDYQGTVNLHLFNVSDQPILLYPGQKLTQFILIPMFYDTVEEVDDSELHKQLSERGEGAFGSTGKF